MALFRIEKVISTLPDPLSPNTIYLVRVGEGFDLYVSDATGSIAHSLNASTESTAADQVFLPFTITSIVVPDDTAFLMASGAEIGFGNVVDLGTDSIIIFV
ncbi:MAG TPA: hypothetical protein ENK70_03665 [Methylophaga sp.]|nr:hypothetical protein [Methylophaga sp.]